MNDTAIENNKKYMDFNCDLGEIDDGGISDSKIIPHVTSVNIACGYHAGDFDIMRRTVIMAKAAGCNIGAHPGFPDIENFGRTNMVMPGRSIRALITDQINMLHKICAEEGTVISHVKPHGALYNMAAKDIELSREICRGILESDVRNIVLVGLAGSRTADAAKEYGIQFAGEVFSDRAYMPDGTLVPRTMDGAVITDRDEIIERVIRMARDGVVRAIDGTEIKIAADTLCLHGDNPGAAEFAVQIRNALDVAGIGVSPIAPANDFAGEFVKDYVYADATGTIPNSYMPQFKRCGENAISVRFRDEISPKVNALVLDAARLIKESAAKNFKDDSDSINPGIEGIIEIVPSYSALMVVYEPEVISGGQLIDSIYELLHGRYTHDQYTNPAKENEITASDVLPTLLSDIETAIERTVEIPVCYGGEYGPDLEFVSRHTGLSEEEIIQRHTNPEYPVYMIGFTAGFPYLGGMDDSLSTPRLETPRSAVPAGSVGIAGNQTGIYSVSSPGGWQIIGRTPIKLYDPDSENPFLLKAGDKIKFRRITPEEFSDIENAMAMEESTNSGNNNISDVVDLTSSTAEVKSTISVISAGPLSTIQDMGRFGYLDRGISRSGAMDPDAFVLGNRLLGNDTKAASIEATLITPTIKFNSDMDFVLTGGLCHAVLESLAKTNTASKIVQMNTVTRAHAGDVLRSASIESGVRTYIAFSGGIDTPLIFGSRSTDRRAMLGGLSGGQPLQDGDIIPIGTSNAKCVDIDTDVESLELKADDAKINSLDSYTILYVTRGPQFDDLSDAGVETFLSNYYLVSKDSDRMGTRFMGPEVQFADGRDGNIITDGIIPGAIQITSSGQPILMNVDAQTTGGYAKPFWLANQSKSKAAQLMPGDWVRFKFVQEK